MLTNIVDSSWTNERTISKQNAHDLTSQDVDEKSLGWKRDCRNAMPNRLKRRLVNKRDNQRRLDRPQKSLQRQSKKETDSAIGPITKSTRFSDRGLSFIVHSTRRRKNKTESVIKPTSHCFDRANGRERDNIRLSNR